MHWWQPVHLDQLCMFFKDLEIGGSAMVVINNMDTILPNSAGVKVMMM